VHSASLYLTEPALQYKSERNIPWQIKTNCTYKSLVLYRIVLYLYSAIKCHSRNRPVVPYDIQTFPEGYTFTLHSTNIVSNLRLTTRHNMKYNASCEYLFSPASEVVMFFTRLCKLRQIILGHWPSWPWG